MKKTKVFLTIPSHRALCLSSQPSKLSAVQTVRFHSGFVENATVDAMSFFTFFEDASFKAAVEGEEWLKGIHGWHNGTLLVYLKPGCVHSAPHSTWNNNRLT